MQKELRFTYKKICMEHYKITEIPECKCCGEKHIEFLTLEHPNKDGGKKRREVLGSRRDGGYIYYRWLIKNNFPKDHIIEILCFNCNITKGLHGHCPHEYE